MKIQAIKLNILDRDFKKSEACSKATVPMQCGKELPKYAYMPKISFTGLWFENNYVNTVVDKEYQGKNLYKDKTGFIDFNKVGWENLSKEPLNLLKATDKEFYTFQHALSLAEANDTTWVRRYNHYNVTKPLAIFHTLNSRESKDRFSSNLKELLNPNRCYSLDIPITDKNGNLSLDCVVFDTETTGLNLKDKSKPLDKIIQIGAIQVKNGKIIQETAYNQLINPEMQISKDASAIHGITNKMLEDKPVIEKVLKSFTNGYLNKQNGIIVAYNSKFDITILNNEIAENNKYSNYMLKPKRYDKVLDPFILIQRIHPYVGVKKKLSEQYKYFFCKNLDNAHDAFADVKGTVDMLKYSLYYLSEHRKDKTKPLTLREVLIFQNGIEVPNIDIKLDKEGCRSNVNFKTSYRQNPIAVDNYFDGYKLTGNLLRELQEEIGIENVKKIKQDGDIVNSLINLDTDNGFKINPEETKRSAKFESSFYVMEKNFKEVLSFANLEPYNEKSVGEIIDLITEKSKHYIHEDSISLWAKNPNPKDIKDGNDMPDLAIIRKIAKEKAAEEIAAAENETV